MAFTEVDHERLDYMLRDLWDRIWRIVRGERDDFESERLERTVRELHHYYVYGMRFNRMEMDYYLEESFRVIEDTYQQFRNAVERRNSRRRPISRPPLP
jgi:hypothetical protein